MKPNQSICREEEMNIPLWDAVMGSAAAPIFFPSYNKHVDGAVMVNNPALMAVTLSISEQASRTSSNSPRKELTPLHFFICCCITRCCIQRSYQKYIFYPLVQVEYTNTLMEKSTTGEVYLPLSRHFLS